MLQHDSLWINATLTVISEPGLPNTVENAVIGCKDGRISHISTIGELTDTPENLAQKVHDMDGRCITPGLIDCHTHLVFGGNRSGEHEMRLQGRSYEEIARSGGGIMSTVQQTRESMEEQLFKAAEQRLWHLIKDGVTTAEIKSGYGLTLEDEAKMLRVIRRLGESSPIETMATFLGAHALPAEFADNPSAYIHRVCNDMLPQLHQQGLVDAVDAFCENIAFSVTEVEKVFATAAALKLPVKIHAEQLSNSGGAKLAATYNAMSADHLEYLDEDGVAAMAASGTVAVLLPGAFYMLAETQKPPVKLLRQYGVPMALATDANPGSSPVLSARLMMVMGCQAFGLTPDEALHGVTINAATALRLQHSHGSLQLGKVADLVVWDIQQPAELAYWLGGNLAKSVFKAGRQIV
jgi:imidazolonepropionase